MINKEMRLNPIVYSSPMANYGIGWGAHTTVGDECKNANIKKALIVSTGLRGTGIVDEIKGILEYHGISTEVFTKVTSNPKDFQIMEGYKVFKDAQCDGIVSVGGGTSIDCGKCIRAVATYDGKPINELANFGTGPWMQVIREYKPVNIPQIALNTTAGTSAETSSNGFFTDTKLKAKKGVLLQNLQCTLGLTDPLLVRTMPERIAAWTGWDALTHAMGSVKRSLQVSHSLFVMAGVIKLISENLREFTYNRMNHTACENMCYAESMAGFGINVGGGPGGKFDTHTFSHPIGGYTDAHHGLLNAILTLPVERINESILPGVYSELAGNALGVDTKGLTRMQAADRFFEEIERMLSDLNITTGHLTEQAGLQQKDIDHVVNTFANEPLMHELTEAEKEIQCGEFRKIIENNL